MKWVSRSKKVTEYFRFDCKNSSDMREILKKSIIHVINSISLFQNYRVLPGVEETIAIVINNTFLAKSTILFA